MQILDWALLALIVLAAALAVRKIIRDRRAGKCCGNCAGCTAHCNAAHAARSDAPRTVVPSGAPRTAHSDAPCTAHSDASDTARCAQNTNHHAG